MNLEQEFEKETGAKAYTDNNLAPKIYSDYFVEWLMEKINHKQCCEELPTKEDRIEEILEAIKKYSTRIIDHNTESNNITFTISGQKLKGVIQK